MFLRGRQAGPQLQAVTTTGGLLGVQHAAPCAYPLRIARSQSIVKTCTVAMLDATLQQVADHLDAGVRMRCIADAAAAAVLVVVDEHERPQRRARRQRQRAPQQHVAVVDDALGRQESLDGSQCHAGLRHTVGMRRKFTRHSSHGIDGHACRRRCDGKGERTVCLRGSRREPARIGYHDPSGPGERYGRPGAGPATATSRDDRIRSADASPAPPRAPRNAPR